MKKTILSVAALAVLGSTIFFSSCKKEEETTTSTMAKISGVAYANLDETNDTLADGSAQTQYETAPEGTKVIASVDPSSYTNNPDNSVNYENVTYEAFVASDGTFSFDSIAAYGNSMNVTLMFSDFAFDTKVYGVDSDGNQITETKNNKYSAANATVSVVGGIEKVQNVTFSY